MAPAHTRVIDLMAAETAFGLAEIVALLGPALDAEVRYRVRDEIERRIFAPFLSGYYDLRWFNGGDNWNGVCAGAIGGAFLYLERDPERLARALALILESLRTFVATAFAADGSTTEGVGYWHYGLTYPIIFAELLRGRTGGALDLLAAPRLRQIAAFPAAMLLAPGHFANFADATAQIPLNPGLIARLAARSGAPGLLSTLAPTAPLQGAASSGLSRTLRDLLWWDGARQDAPPLADTLLPASGIARLTGRTATGAIDRAGDQGGAQRRAPQSQRHRLVHRPRRRRNAARRSRPRTLRPRLFQRAPLREPVRELPRPQRPPDRGAITGHGPRLRRGAHGRCG